MHSRHRRLVLLNSAAASFCLIFFVTPSPPRHASPPVHATAPQLPRRPGCKEPPPPPPPPPPVDEVCALPLSELRLDEENEDRARGVHRNQTCSLRSLLARVLARPSNGCELQSRVLGVATRLTATVEGGAFTLLQDCTNPPCCAHLLEEFAQEHPAATVLGAGTRQAAAAADSPPPNLWQLRPARRAAEIARRREPLRRRCAAGCVTLQIAHGWQGHGLASVLEAAAASAAAAAAAAAAAEQTPGARRLLQWMSQAELQREQERRAHEKQQQQLAALRGPTAAVAAATAADRSAAAVQSTSHDGWLRAARALSGAQQQPVATAASSTTMTVSGKMVVVPSNRRVVGPAATSSAAAARAEGAEDGGRGGGSGGGGDGGPTVTTYAASLGDSAVAPLAQSEPRGADGDGTQVAAPTSDRVGGGGGGGGSRGGSGDAEHLAALGVLLGSASRTLLLLPAAEALEASISRAEEEAGLPAAVAARLRESLPYRSRAEEDGLLHAAAATTGLDVVIDRVSGRAQSAAMQVGHTLLVVQRAPSAAAATAAAAAGAAAAASGAATADPHSPTADGAAAAAGGLLLSVALATRPVAAERCRLRALLAAAPLREDMSEEAQGWRLVGSTIRPARSAAAAAVGGGRWRGRNGGDGGGDDDEADEPPLADLSRWLPVAPALLEALRAAETHLRASGACDDARAPLVLRPPAGAAAQAGACAVPTSRLLAPALEQRRRDVACPRARPVLCGDGACRPTFLHCAAASSQPRNLSTLLRMGCRVLH